jgi:hypothetical protein
VSIRNGLPHEPGQEYEGIKRTQRTRSNYTGGGTMWHSPRFWAVAFRVAAALILSLPPSAQAVIDLTGPWKVGFVTPPSQSIPFPGNTILTCPLDFAQAGSSLTVKGTCSLPAPPPFNSLSLNLSGTIDSVSGAFTVAGPIDQLCASFTITATAAPDGHSFSSGDIFVPPPGYLCSPSNTFGAVFGTRCGNGVLEPWEQCEPTGPNDCCNRATCQFDAGASCDDGNPCTTTDHCDAAGSCIPGPPLVCEAPCEDPVCDPLNGCLAAIDTCVSPTEHGSKLTIKNVSSNPDTGDLLQWTWKKGPEVLLGDFGDPTTTSYTVCLSILQPVPRRVFSATVPAGSTWRSSRSGLTFKDSTGMADGLVAVTLKSGPAGRGSIKVKGKGTNLHPPFLPLPSTRSSRRSERGRVAPRRVIQGAIAKPSLRGRYG